MFSENSLIKKQKQESVADYEVQYHLLEQQIKQLIEKKKANEITREELMEQRKPLDEQLDYPKLSAFKQQELIEAFQFQGDEEVRQSILKSIQNKQSIAEIGSNQRGVFEMEGNKIVKLVSKANYPFELPMVTLTKDLSGPNVVKTYDVFEKDDLVYVVQDKAPGKEVHKYSEEEIAAIPQEHYDNLVQLVNTYAAHGIGTDPSKISNLFYDPEKGFTIIDLGAATYQRGLNYHIDGYFTNNLAHEKIHNAVAKFGEYQLKPILPTLQDKLELLNK